MKILTAVLRIHLPTLCLDLETDEGNGYLVSEALKPAVLAICAPVLGDLPTDEFVVPARPASGLSETTVRGTQDPVVLELARRWMAGELPDTEGPVVIPTFADADKAQWSFDGDALTLKRVI